MPVIKTVNGFKPEVADDCFIADDAVLCGEVSIGRQSSVWFGAVLRADVGAISIGERTNVQDGVMMHASYGKSKVVVGNDVTIGHKAIIHGATINDLALIGMNSTVLDNAVVGEGAIVAAGAVVLAGTVIEPYTLWAGIPAKCVKILDKEKTAESHKAQAEHYIHCSSWYSAE